MDDTAVSPARAAADAYLGFERLRRRAEAGAIASLCKLAKEYHLEESELVEALVERQLHPGGEGTPTVSEFLSLEVAAMAGCSITAAAGKIADALNLKYRHPLLYEAVQELRIDAGRALKAASRCSQLHPIQADAVTTAWLKQQAGKNWTAAFNALDKLIIASDTKLAAERERVAREDRGVWAWGAFEGVMNITGRLDVTDARLVDDRLSYFADLLADQFPALTHAQRRAKALGVLTDPYHAVTLLETQQQPMLPYAEHQCCSCHGNLASQPVLEPPEEPRSGPGPEAVARALREAPGPVLIEEPPPPQGSPPPPHDHPTKTNAKPTCTSGGRTLPSPGKHRPTLTLNVHIHSDALGESTGVARVEKAGHITTTLLSELIGEIPGLKVRVQPVIDLPNLAPADAYVPSAVMHTAVVIAWATDAFPFSSRPSEGLDLDHTIAFQPGGSDQTSLDNLGPLSRTPHRAKTAGWWHVTQPEAGLMRWTSPLGYHYQVTPNGCTRLDDAFKQIEQALFCPEEDRAEEDWPLARDPGAAP